MSLEKLTKKELIERVEELSNELNHYQQLVALYQKEKYGSKSEKSSNYDQLSLFDEIEVESTPIKIEPELEEITYKRKKKKGKRDLDLSKYETEQIVYDVDNKVCDRCDSVIRKVSQNVRRELIYIPAKYKVIEHIQYVYVCDHCDEDKTNFIKGAMPQALLPKSVLSSSLASDIIYNKFNLSLPLYRQEVMFKQNNLDISRQTMSNWLTLLYDYYLVHMINYMHKKLLKMKYIQADETTVQVLKEKDIAVSTKSYMWVYKSGRSEEKQLILYKYEPTRGHRYASVHLEGYKGILQTDGYQAYDKVNNVTQAGCLVHARRYFVTVLDAAPKNINKDEAFSHEIICEMQKLFKIEKDVSSKSYDEIKAYRQEKSKPIFEKMMERIRYADTCHIPTESLKKAVTYCINQEQKLAAYLDDGRIEISNNSTERAIRNFCVGRKNWIFSNTPHGAHASSCYYSIVESAKMNNLNIREYITHILSVLPNIDLYNENELEKIMPWSNNLPKTVYQDKKS